MEPMAVYERFAACMASFLNGTSVPFDTKTWTMDEWKALYALARRQSLSGALCTALGTSPMPDAAKTRLQHQAFQMMMRYEAQQEILADIARGFDEAAVDHLFFKGAVVRDYYPHPAMRSMGDVDLVIRPDTVDRAHQAMLSLGFVCEEEGGEVWTYTRHGYMVEMHTAVRRYDVHRQDTVWYDDPFAEVVPIEGHTYRWCDEQEAAHAVMHLAAHFCAGGCGLRQWMDVAVLCNRFSTDAFWNAVLTRLEPFGMSTFARLTLGMCRVWFGAAAPTACCFVPDEATQAELLCRVLQDGTFGNDERLMLADARKKMRRRESGHVPGGWRRILPEAEYIRLRFPYAARHSVLLPLAYVHRLVQGVTKNRRIHWRRLRYAHEQQDNLEREVQFFESIGL